MRYFNTRMDMLRYLTPPHATICEIGVHRGIFARFLFTLNPRMLVLIDPFVGIVPSGDHDGNNVVEVDLEKVYEELSKNIHNLKNIRLQRGYSQRVMPHFPDRCFDVIYIDGDHTYEGVKSDLNLSLQKVKPGGFICGHDYEMNHMKTPNTYDFGVKRAVDEFCQAHGFEIWAKGLDGCVSYAIRVPHIPSGGTTPASSDSETDRPQVPRPN